MPIRDPASPYVYNATSKGCDLRFSTLRWLTAFRECKQVIVPVSISMRTKIRTMRTLDDRDVGPLVTDLRVKGVCFLVDRTNNLLPTPFPSSVWIPQMRDAFIGIDTWLLVNARDQHISH
jgi:hypothetical protein